MSFSSKVGYTLLTIIMVTAIIAPPLLSNGPFSFHYDSYLSPSKTNWLGTNHLGQDLFTQLMYGARTTIIIGFSVAALSTLLSAVFGLLSGYSKRLDPFINGLGNILIVVPSLLLIIVIISFTSGSLMQLILVLGCLTWAPYMRIIRSTTLTLKEREFVKASRLYGGKPIYILRKHIVPHIAPIIKTKFILSFRTAILTEAGLSFLGLGDPNVISWGRMIHEGFSKNAVFMTNAWQWILLPPISLLILLTIAIVLISEEKKPMTKRLRNTKIPHPHFEGQPQEQYILQCNDLAVELGGKMVLQNINFNVGYGKIVSVIGTSGSGKTTLGKAIYGLLSPEHVTGAITVQQRQLYRSSNQHALHYWKDISFIYQDPRTALNPVLTIENQFFEVIDSTIPKAQKRIIVEQALKEVQLTPSILKKYPHQLSGGMLNRVMIALAFIHHPGLIIADESTSGLDPLMKREIVELIKAKAQANGSTLLFITHDIEVAYYISDEVIELEDGKLINYEKI